jgi:hypothetical protein
MDAVNQENNNKKLSKVLSTKLSLEDYNAFQMLTKLEYESELIKEKSTSELLRFTIRHILTKFVISLNIITQTRTATESSKPAIVSQMAKLH